MVFWQHCFAYAAKLNTESYLSYADWRIPNELELQSLMDYSQAAVALPTGHPFSNVQNEYWSSTTYAATKSYARTVLFTSVLGYGALNMLGKAFGYSLAFVWPVRAGQVAQTITSSTTTSTPAATTTTTAAAVNSTTTTMSAGSSTTTTSIGSGCAVTLLPGKISRMLGSIQPFGFILIRGDQARRFRAIRLSIGVLTASQR